MAEKQSEFDRGMIVGAAIACSIIQSCFDNPVAVREVLGAMCLNRRKMKRAGVDDYDLKILRPVLAEMRAHGEA